MTAVAPTPAETQPRRTAPLRVALVTALVYAVAVLAVLHFWWMRAAKSNFNEVLVYAVILGALLAWRLQRAWQRKRQRAAKPT